MLSVILEFDVIDGKENEFRELWIKTTKYIYEHFGSLGSRLHRSDNGKFIAYAQWPSLDIYDKQHNWSGEALSVRNSMLSTLKTGQLKVLHKLVLDSDLLKSNVFGASGI